MGHLLLLPFGLSAERVFSCTRPSLSRVCLTADKLVLPSGLQAVCLRAVILGRWSESA